MSAEKKDTGSPINKERNTCPRPELRCTDIKIALIYNDSRSACDSGKIEISSEEQKGLKKKMD